MRSQFEFFMTGEDEKEFLSMAGGLTDSIDRQSDTQWHFLVGDCPIQFLRCELHSNEFISGRIAIATSGFGISWESGNAGEKAYKRMRNWLKKSYSNKMTCRNIHIESSTMELKNFWYSHRVADLHSRNPDLALKQVPGGYVVFEPLLTNDNRKAPTS